MFIKVTDIVWNTEDPEALKQLRTEQPLVINTRKIPKGQSLENYIWELCDFGEYIIATSDEYDFDGTGLAWIVSFSTSHSMELTKEYYLEKLDRLRRKIRAKMKEQIFAMKRKLFAMKRSCKLEIMKWKIKKMIQLLEADPSEELVKVLDVEPNIVFYSHHSRTISEWEMLRSVIEPMIEYRCDKSSYYASEAIEAYARDPWKSLWHSIANVIKAKPSWPYGNPVLWFH